MKDKPYNLIHGDAGFLPLADSCIDLTVTSPPYDNLRDYKGHSFDFEKVAKELFRVTKQGGVVVWVVGDATVNGSETLTSFRQALFFKELGFNVETMIYEVAGTGAKGSNYYYWQSFDFMFVFAKGQPKTSNRLADKINTSFGTTASSGDKQRSVGTRLHRQKTLVAPYGIRTNIWRYQPSNNNDRTDHPAPFPEQLAADHIKSWSNEGDIVLDCFLGSGTTGKMAVILNRKFIGVEISKEYLAIAKPRIKRANLEWAEIPRREVERVNTGATLFG